MALIPYPDEHDATAQALGDQFEKRYGRPSHLLRMLTWYPPAIEALRAIGQAKDEGKLTRSLREILYVAASAARGCTYCAEGHAKFLVERLGTPEHVAAAVLNDEELSLTSAETKLVDFVRKVASRPHETVQGDIDQLLDAGWGYHEIVEAAAMAMFAAFTNTLASALHLEDDVEWDVPGG